VALELAELASGLPFAASFAMAGGISLLREGRRRTALNEAMHELRRPLQAIALATPPAPERAQALESSLRLATAAVERLDREINGGPWRQPVEAVPLRRLAEAAVERWQARAAIERREVRLRWRLEDPGPPVDAAQLAQVLDNLISNGLDHGCGEVTVEATRVGDAVRLLVANRERPRPARPRIAGRELRTAVSGRRRRGHGLRIVRRAAARNGLGFRLRRQGGRCLALLELPLSEGSS
jgi:signal transduction histidine kinase